MIVVIPIHNQGKNLAHVLSAYMVQTVMPEHIILVCDRCTDISKDLASSFISKFAVFDCVLHVIDTNGSNVTGFGAGRTRDVGVTYAKSLGLTGPYFFSDGDCVPSTGLVAHHKSQLGVAGPRITCGLRYETVPPDQKPDFPVIETNPEVIQDDLRVSADYCKYKVFGQGCDRLVLIPEVIEHSWVCWSCNLGMNDAAIDLCYYVNGALNGDTNRIFNSAFDGRWGGEDGFVGCTLYRWGGEIVALGRQSNVVHIWHPRNHTNLDHINLMISKDVELCSQLKSSRIGSNETSLLFGLVDSRGNFDASVYSTIKTITAGIMLTNVSRILPDDDVLRTGLLYLCSGVIKFHGALPGKKPTRKTAIDVLCKRAQEIVLSQLQVSVVGYAYSTATPLGNMEETV